MFIRAVNLIMNAPAKKKIPIMLPNAKTVGSWIRTICVPILRLMACAAIYVTVFLIWKAIFLTAMSRMKAAMPAAA